MKDSEEQLEVLQKFLGAFGDTVEARGRIELTEGEKASLGELARGELDDGGREMLIPLLAKNELAMEYLAGLLE